MKKNYAERYLDIICAPLEAAANTLADEVRRLNEELAEAKRLLLRVEFALDFAVTAAALANTTCAEFPDGGRVCGECIGCMYRGLSQASAPALRDVRAFLELTHD